MHLSIALTPVELVPCGLATQLGAHPGIGIDGLAVVTNLEIQGSLRLSAGIADLSDDLSGRHPVSGLFQYRFIMTIQTHVPVTVIDDHQ